MIGTNGKNLSILISCEYSTHDCWQVFANYYAISQFLPEAKVSILCARQYPQDFTAFHWVNKVGVPFFQHKNHYADNREASLIIALKEQFVSLPCVAITAEHLCLRPLYDDVAKNMSKIKFGKSNDLWFLNEDFTYEIDNIRTIIDDGLEICNLANNADDENASVFTNFRQMDQFSLKNWRENKVFAPFKDIGKFITATSSANTKKALRIWSKLTTIYEVFK